MKCFIRCHGTPEDLRVERRSCHAVDPEVGRPKSLSDEGILVEPVACCVHGSFAVSLRIADPRLHRRRGQVPRDSRFVSESETEHAVVVFGWCGGGVGCQLARSVHDVRGNADDHGRQYDADGR